MIEEVKKCACGLDMVPPQIGVAAVMCPNCDTIQSSEYTGVEGERGSRIITLQDRRFNLEWERRKRVYYPRNGKAAA